MRDGVFPQVDGKGKAAIPLGSRWRIVLTACWGIALTGILAVGCSSRKSEESTATSGSLLMLVSSAAAPVIQKGADEFNRLYVQANVVVYPLDSRSMVDSLIHARSNAAYFDRALSAEESLAIVQSRRHLYSFHLGSTVACWIVHPDNPLAAIDSLRLLEILSGRIADWQKLTDYPRKIILYLPPIGDGAWMAMQDYFGEALSEVAGHYYPSDSLVIERLAGDPGGLGFVVLPPKLSGVKKLRWIHPLLADPVPANIGALQEGKYPFEVRLCYYTIAERLDLAAGFLSFMAANTGQRIIADHGYLPGMVPVRVVTLSPSQDQ